jgi:hypothetical protein
MALLRAIIIAPESTLLASLFAVSLLLFVGVFYIFL